ncbi:cell division cycle-associated 7-like protein [Morus notabilis]|uniref:cell division cycle-associated 7-like protein n=1 Tax=Morus notabilis TaxID=981085 RepID=UPI000CED2A6E|nr:cell division cycle-associated 7-like protein [Morus notabilis]
MGRLRAKSDYEDLRNARILENQNRLKTLGLQKTISDLRSVVSSSSPPKTQVRNYTKKVYETGSLRRSNRLKQISSLTITPKRTSLRRSSRLRGNGKPCHPITGKKRVVEDHEDDSPRPANMPLVVVKGSKDVQLSPEALTLRCSSRGRGGVYDPLFGICCHFCRQKKLCGEEDCKRCSNLDMDEPCIGKTDCSVCHSSHGVFCRGCLKVRYGEEMEEVIRNKEWMCPHCIEEKGIKSYWICNSSICLKKRNMAPTGLAIYRAQELGYKSVAHLLMDQLQGVIKRRKS